MLTQPLTDALQTQLTLEHTNSVFYDTLAVGLKYINWPGFAEFMGNSAADERGHADRIAQYLVARNVVPVQDKLPAVSAPSGENPLQFFTAALEREKTTTQSILDLYRLADSEDDPQTCVFLHWFIEEQTNSEAELQDIIKELARTEVSDQPTLDEEYRAKYKK